MGWQRSFTLNQEDMGNRTLSCITWSPNGKTLAVGYTDGTIQLFGVETGLNGRPVPCHRYDRLHHMEGALARDHFVS